MGENLDIDIERTIYWNHGDINKEFVITDTEPNGSTLQEVLTTHDPWFISVKTSTWFMKLMEIQSLDVRLWKEKVFSHN